MKKRLSFLALAAAALVITVPAYSASDGEKAVLVAHDSVATALAKGGAIASGSDYKVSGVRRAKAGQVEVHEKETDIFYIVDGEAEFITGGTMVGGKSSGNGQWLGTSIEGGQQHHLSKGDVIVIPAGTPHWFKEIPQSINYYMVKVVKP
jgi:mannose-6-phosphate isomerase-like protein (cupin superfamily)